MSSPTQRSLALIRKAGNLAGVTEHWNQYARIRQDLLGFIDIISVVPGQGIIAVQTTSASNQAARIAKIQQLEAARTWLESGARIEVHGWKKVRGRWQVTVTEVKLDPKEKTDNGLFEPCEPDARDADQGALAL